MKILKIVAFLLACALSSFGSVYAFHEEGGSEAFSGDCITIREDDIHPGITLYDIVNKCGRNTYVRIGCDHNPVSDQLLAIPESPAQAEGRFLRDYSREGVYTRHHDYVWIGWHDYPQGMGFSPNQGGTGVALDVIEVVPILTRRASYLLCRFGRFRLGAAGMYV